MDPTEALRAEMSAAFSARHLERIVNRVPAFIAQLDRRGRFSYINDAYATFFRRSREEIIGREPREIFSASEYREIEPRMRAALSGQGHSYQRQVTDPLGATITLQVELLPETPGGNGGMVVIAHDITGLKNSEARFSLHSHVLGSMTENVLLLDEEGMVVYHNAAAERNSGLDTASIIGKHFLSLQAGPAGLLAEKFREAREKTLSGGSWSGEWQAIREGGDSYPTQAEISGFVMGGRPFLIVVQRDISREKRAREELAFSELRFRFLAEAMPQMAWLASAHGKGQYVNQRWLDYCGIEDRAEAQAAWADFVHPDDRERSVRGWQTAALGGVPFEIQYRLRSLTGEYRWFLARCLPVHESEEPGAAVLAWVGTATDIHAQKESEELIQFWADVSSALYSSLDYEDRLSRIAALAMLKFGGWCVIHAKGDGGSVVPVAIAHSDSSQVKRAWESAQRLPVGEDAKVGIGWVIHHEETQMFAEVTDELVRLAARDEEHLALMRQASIKSFLCMPIRGKNGVIGTMSLLSSTRNFSARDRVLGEELAGRSGIALENARLYGEATRAVSARDNLLSVTSHELRTPVTSLKLQLQMARRQLRAGGLDPTALERSLDISIRQVDRLNTLIEDLLNFSSVSAGKMRYHFVEADVAAILSETIERHAEAARISKTPLRQLGPPSLNAQVDPLRFGQVVENLITNALKYGAGGEVDLSLEKQGATFTLKVSDHGIGIAPDKLGAVFERYERVGPTQGISGFGLGLYVSRAFVLAHRGTISVESTPKVGSCFTVTMPLIQG